MPDGRKYYEFLVFYTDDTMCISHKAKHVMRNEIGKYFELKEESIGTPKLYLGGHLRNLTLEKSVEAWAFSSSQYVKTAVKTVETYLETQTRWKLPRRAETPIRTEYRPEIDVSPELVASDSSWYQTLIGILRWIV